MRVLVVGAGVVGLWIAREGLAQGWRVWVLEAGSALGEGASGHNSGVLHAGVFYRPGTRKAAWCAEGNARWRAWLATAGVPWRATGKVLVGLGAGAEDGLARVEAQAKSAGVPLVPWTRAEAVAFDPRLKAARLAAFAPTTAVLEPLAALSQLASEIRAAGGQIDLGQRWLAPEAGGSATTLGRVEHDLLLNAAGRQAWSIARAWGEAADLRPAPYRGAYLVGPDLGLKAQVYPIPDPALPFLGVHLTAPVGGGTWIGPTSWPVGPPARTLRRLWGRSEQRWAFLQEVRRRSRRALVAEAGWLLAGLPSAAAWSWGQRGVRAQLAQAGSGALVEDLEIRRGPGAVHLLNLVSPAMTCAPALAQALVRSLA
jgi:L-2-hydroxyglutarate oxidase LhgO